MTILKELFPTEVKPPKLGVLHWVSKLMAGVGGMGEKIPYSRAVLAAQNANHQSPDVYHWVEPVLEDAT